MLLDAAAASNSMNNSAPSSSSSSSGDNFLDVRAISTVVADISNIVPRADASAGAKLLNFDSTEARDGIKSNDRDKSSGKIIITELD